MSARAGRAAAGRTSWRAQLGSVRMQSLPPGFRAGHWTDRDGATGCTVVLPPPGCVGAAEVRGGGPGTRESDQLSPASRQRFAYQCPSARVW